VPGASLSAVSATLLLLVMPIPLVALVGAFFGFMVAAGLS
jgi:hypothetical protein